MIRHLLALLAIVSVPATAAERSVGVGSFERLRIAGPFEVTFTPGSPRVRVTGDARVIERVEVRVEGTTLTVRMSGQDWGEQRAVVARAPIVVALSAPSLSAVSVFAGGRLTATRMKGTRVDLSISGSGEIAVADATADQLVATLVGAGAMTLAGRAGKARLVTNGAGRIDASALKANDLVVLLDGTGATKASARVNAAITNSGLGQVIVTGDAKCAVSARSGGTVTCGKQAPAREGVIATPAR